MIYRLRRQPHRWRRHAENTHSGRFGGNTLLVLSLERVTEETDRKVERRCQHTVPRELDSDKQAASNGSGTTN